VIRNDAILLALLGLVEVLLLGLLAEAWGAAALGALLALAGGVYGLAGIRSAIDRIPKVGARRGQNLVLAALVRSMVGRMLLLGAGLVLGIAALALPPLPIVLAFFGVYALTLGLELRLALATRAVAPADDTPALAPRP
jgi:hypothetical protein